MRSRLAICVDIIRETESAPKRSSAIASAMGGAVRLNVYLNLLAPKGYLAVNGDGLYACTSQGRKALVAYDALETNGFIASDVSIREIDLAVLRELGDGNYKAGVGERTRLRAKIRLGQMGHLRDGHLSDEGREVLSLAEDLFGLVDCTLSI